MASLLPDVWRGSRFELRGFFDISFKSSLENSGRRSSLFMNADSDSSCCPWIICPRTNVFVSGMGEAEVWKPGQIVEQEFDLGVVEVYNGTQESIVKITDNAYGYDTTAYRPVYGSDGKIQAVAGEGFR